LRAPVQGVRALTSFSFDKLSRNSEGFASGEVIDSGPLSIKAEAGAVLALRRNPKICNRPFHDQRAYHRMPFGRSANQSNVIALFMLQQRRRTNSFHFALRHAAMCGSRAHVYFRVGIAGLSARGARVPSLALLTRKQQPH
jgi:hypothetical protein